MKSSWDLLKKKKEGRGVVLSEASVQISTGRSLMRQWLSNQMSPPEVGEWMNEETHHGVDSEGHD